jgi:transposase
MFIRRKKNPNGFTTIQIVDKSSGLYRVIKNFGVAKTKTQQEQYLKEAQTWINQRLGRTELDFYSEDKQVEALLDSIQSLRLIGLELVLGKIFDDIGFSQVQDPVFRYLSIYRASFPVSKLKTTEYLYRYHQIYWEEDKIYRYLDTLHKSHKQLVQQISFDHTLQILNGEPLVVFYDVTTLHFEIDQEDAIRKTGFSKSGKHQNPQIVLGLLVSKFGYPLAYDIFEGSTFEGHTMLPVIESFRKQYQLPRFTVVADAGLMSGSNIELLFKNGYEFIIGARIKNESRQLQQQILSHRFKNGENKVFVKDENTKLIVTYSDSRAAKDKHNRERGLKRLEKQLKRGRLTKSNINNKGYNKYLKLTGDIEIKIDYEKYKADANWDGLKGYVTNSSLSIDEILANYNQLWQIEKAFRISKTDLKIRPIYHRLQRRIEAHICLTFVAYKMYKELERRLEQLNSPIKAKKVIEIAQSIFQIEIQTPKSKKSVQKILLLNEEQKQLAKILKFPV